MASPSHAVMLREISAAGDRESTGALDIAWDGAQASLFFKFGRPRHVVYTMADGRALVGEAALAALMAELPADVEVAVWRRAVFTEETLDLTTDELIALLDPDGPAHSNGSVTSSPGPQLGLLEPGSEPAPARPAFGMAHFPLLPLGPVLWSDTMANVVDLEAMLPLLPNCLLVLTLPEPQAAALVAEGAITDAVWMTGGQGMLGESAARALMDSRDGELTAYRIDDPRMSTVLRTLLGDPTALVSMAGAVDAPPAPEPDAELPVPAEEAAQTTPTFDGASVPSTSSSLDAAAPAVAAPPPVPSAFGPVAVRRSPLQVALRVLASLGIYALSWRKDSNLELERFDPNVPARQGRSTRSSVAAWLTALLIAAAGAVLFASTRSFRLPLDRQLTSSEAYYLMGGLACLYLIVIVPFNLAGAKADLRRLRLVQEHVGIGARRRMRLGTARLMIIPVIGRLVLLGLEQQGINAIWTAATLANAPGVDVLVDRSPAVDGGPDTGISTETEPAAEVSDDGSAEPESAPDSPDVSAAEHSADLGAIFSEMQAQPVWIRIASPKPDQDAQTEPSPPRADPVWFHIPAPQADEASVVLVEVDSTVDASVQADAPGAAAVQPPSTEPSPDFVPPRLDIDVDALRHGLTEIAEKWLGADAMAPVAAAIAAARPGVDDFVAAIAAIRGMEIPGRESPIVRAMAREMHYYATEVLCAA